MSGLAWRAWETCLECVRGHGKHTWNATAWECLWNARVATNYASIFGCGKAQSHSGIHAWACLEDTGKPPGMSEGIPGMVELQPIVVLFFSSPHGKHAWNARGVRNISGVLVHGWVPKACWWETYLPRCSMIAALLTKSRYTKVNLFQKSCMTILSYAPISGDG